MRSGYLDVHGGRGELTAQSVEIERAAVAREGSGTVVVHLTDGQVVADRSLSVPLSARSFRPVHLGESDVPAVAGCGYS